MVAGRADNGVAGQCRPAEYEVEVIPNVRIPASAPGLTLAGDLYLPRTSRTVPVLITLHSARRDAMAGMSVRRYFRYFAERGYACLLVDCRGTGDSDGLQLPLLDPAEADDGVAVVRWAAEQSWCTGRVGMWGLSLGGTNSLATASRQPPELRAIMPVMGLLDAGRDMIYPGGSRSGMGFAGRICLHDIIFQLLPPLLADSNGDFERRWKSRVERFEPWIIDTWLTSEHDDVWASRRTDPSKINVPSFFVTGWRDFCADPMIRAYEQVDAPKQLLSGPWLHAFPEASPVEVVDLPVLACAWWDRWLHSDEEVDSSWENSATFFVQGESRWVTSSQWPPEGSSPSRFIATSSRGLIRVEEEYHHRGDGSDPSSDEELLAYETDLTVGPLSGLWTQPTSKIGYPLDQHDDDSRSLSFTTSPLETNLVLAGSASVSVALDPMSTASTCVAKLTDVDPQGRSTVITSGIVDLTNVTADDTQSIHSVRIALSPACYEVPKGHCLRLVLACADFPRLWPTESDSGVYVHACRDSVEGESRMCSSKDSTITSVVVPVMEVRSVRETTVPRPIRPAARKSHKKFPEPSFRVTRDHCRDSVSLHVEQVEGGVYLEGSDKSIELERVLTATVEKSDASTAHMTAWGSCTAETEVGDALVVSASIEVRDGLVSAEGTLTKNGAQVISRRWSSQ